MSRILIVILICGSVFTSARDVYALEDVSVSKLTSSRGKKYAINRIVSGGYQYMDRDYQFNYVPEELNGSLHIKTHGNDKLISENDTCFSFVCNCDIDVYILFADKFPVLPSWLNQFERTRLNVTRMDSNAANLKGYFSLYRKSFSKGQVVLNGCSPTSMLEKKGFVESMGSSYCMYTVVIKEKE
ncbi:MAG: hypothetical protein JXP36_12340 [Bacteroidales bacterium]|nr:hypothetical protein [Bacteroidales bacterium]